MQEAELPKISAVQRIKLKPGDVLVAYVPRLITEAMAQRLKEKINARLGVDLDRIMVLGDGITLGVVKP